MCKQWLLGKFYHVAVCVCVCVCEFPYLGLLIASSGRMDVDVDRKVAQASKAFGALRKAVFPDKNLSLTTKSKLYDVCVLSVLLGRTDTFIGYFISYL